MAEFTVTISEMNSASGDIKSQAENFRTTAGAMQTATQALVETGWDDDASRVFAEKIGELKTWCDSMSDIIDTYSEALTKIASGYNDADAQAASQFK